MTLRRALFLSLLVHGGLLLLLRKFEVGAERQHTETIQRTAARQHSAVYQRNASQTYAKRLQRIRELIERLDAEQKEKPNEPAKPSAEPAAERPAALEERLGVAAVEDVAKPVPPAIPELKKDEIQLWRESRQDYEATRERYLEQKAKRLAELTKTSLEEARKKVRSASSEGAGGAGEEPQTAGAAMNGIEGMHADAQRMLTETLQRAREQAEGQSLTATDVRDAYTLAQNQESARESQNFDSVVDWTPLMGRTSNVAVNGKLDSPDDLRRVATAQNPALRQRFSATAQRMAFTRRLGEPASGSADWVCPDAWYVIGPFPNRDREAIDRSYPPELEIDRDALYEGKNGRPVFWEYLRTHKPSIIPPHLEEYAVYYAFTEIYCAKPMDVWLTIGSDDHSKLWVNGLMVWSGSKDQKDWTPTEGFRRVHLQGGVNRFLFRLENGWQGAAFSVLIGLE